MYFCYNLKFGSIFFYEINLFFDSNLSELLDVTLIRDCFFDFEPYWSQILF